MKFINIFTVRIVYENGYTHDFECTEFEVKASGALSWTTADPAHKPMLIAGDLNQIVAVWQIRHRRKLVWGK